MWRERVPGAFENQEKSDSKRSQALGFLENLGAVRRFCNDPAYNF